MPRLAGPKVILANVMRTTAAAAHQMPLGWILRGSGGGWPGDAAGVPTG